MGRAFWTRRAPSRAVFWATVAAAAYCLGPAGPAAAQELVERKESIYNSIFIYKDGSYVSMMFGRNRRLYQESRANQADPLELPTVYTRYMTVGLAYAAEPPTRLLEIGVGGGTTVAYLEKTFETMRIDAVELDPVVLDFAATYFFLKETDRLKLHVRDGRIFLRRNRKPYDVILVDAYRGPFVPFHLLTKEFFTLAKKNLNEGGVLVQNVDPSTILYDSTVATIDAVFDHVDVFEARGNFVLVAYDGAKLDDAVLAERAAALDARHQPRYPLATLVKGREDASGDDGDVLTDDFAPVEYLKAVERNNNRRE